MYGLKMRLKVSMAPYRQTLTFCTIFLLTSPATISQQIVEAESHCKLRLESEHIFYDTPSLLLSMEPYQSVYVIREEISEAFKTKPLFDMKDFNNNTLIDSNHTYCIKNKYNGELTSTSIPSVEYKITEAEVLDHLDNPEWFLKKMIAFGSTISKLTQIQDLSPGPLANTLFGGLVTLAREFPNFKTTELMEHPVIQLLKPKVVEKSGIAEYYLEVFHAKKIIRGEMLLKEFLYYENYRLLMNFEAKCIRKYFSSDQVDRIRKVVFIGSGPMPLSSIELIRYLPRAATIVNYDQSQEAVELGAALVETQNLTHRISTVKCSALEISDLKDVDVVYLAALAGSTAVEKKIIIRHFYKIMKPGSLIVARSAFGLRTFLYQRLTAQNFGEFQDFRHFNPSNKVIINSVAMAMKPN